jgi:hypothetical protein
MVHCSGGAQILQRYIIKEIIYFQSTLVSVNSGAIKTDWKRCIKFLTAVIAWIVRSRLWQDIIAISNPLTMLK